LKELLVTLTPEVAVTVIASAVYAFVIVTEELVQTPAVNVAIVGLSVPERSLNVAGPV
jgi:hypothetical protein